MYRPSLSIAGYCQVRIFIFGTDKDYRDIGMFFPVRLPFSIH